MLGNVVHGVRRNMTKYVCYWRIMPYVLVLEKELSISGRLAKKNKY